MATRRSGTDGGTGLPKPVVEDLLSDDNRRRALAILADHGEPMVVESLAVEVVATRDDCEPADISEPERDAMSEELYTDHLPKLTATDVVAYDSMLGTVELRHPDRFGGDRFAQFR